MKRLYKYQFYVSGLLILIFSCTPKQETNQNQKEEPKFKIVSEIKSDKESQFYIPLDEYPEDRKSLPIGVFDSGTGGLAVLNTIYEMDNFNNSSHQKGTDGEMDFAAEKFIYLADDANMPYGRYDAEGKADFLRELVIKDVQFLLDDEYYTSPDENTSKHDKQNVKAIVIACNTATAYGLETVQNAVDYWGLDVEIFGIVDAGAREVLSNLQNPEKSIIGVLATEGTVSSKGYPKAILKNYGGDIAIVQQAGIGLAGAIDGDLNYIDPQATNPRDSKAYQGPDIGHEKYPLDESLWEEYNFEEGNSLLVATNDNGDRKHAQLNSVNNYIRYMVTHMVKNTLDIYPDKTISRVILGCTHYPYEVEQIKEHFLYIRGLNETYEALIAEDIQFIDPSESLGAELYSYMVEEDLWGKNRNEDSEFYISVPNTLLEENVIGKNGKFTYDYKYGRVENVSMQYVKRVPFSDEWIDATVKERMKTNIPYTYEMIYKQ
ncbi:MAG: aspartate/glutamate racemase family protein [Bacteroidota bacterium]